MKNCSSNIRKSAIKIAKKVLPLIGAIGLAVSLSGCSSSLTKSNQSSAPTSTSNNGLFFQNSNDVGGLSKTEYQKLANSIFKNNTYGYYDVQNGKSTLNPKSWKTNKVIYQNLDRFNRTSASNTGFLEKRNLANGSLRVRQTIAPTGWHYNHGDKQIYNRGHLIAYSVSAGIDQNGNYNPKNQSGDQNNPKNLFTQSAYSNQQLQTIFENKVRKALKANKKVIYQATPIFKSNEKMARGVNLQAISTDGSLNFNVFIFNIQPGYKFNYTDGRAKKDSSVVVKNLPPSLQSHYNNSNSSVHKYKSNNYHYNQRKHYRSKHYGSYDAYNYDKNRTDQQAQKDEQRFIHRQYNATKDEAKKSVHEAVNQIDNWWQKHKNQYHEYHHYR